jgi:RNA polymerase-binding transcription factor DksA
MTFRLSEPADRADPADLAQAQAETTREIALRQHLRPVRMLSDQQIDERGVVHCEDCDAPIDLPRLAALAPKDGEGQPLLRRSTAVRCTRCQNKAEREQFLNTGRRR